MKAGVIRVLLIGCGDVAMRTASLLRRRARLYGLIRRPEDAARLREHGVIPLIGDLDHLESLRRLRAAPFAVLHFAPPPSDGRDDPRTRKLLAALTRSRSIPRRLVYISTTGVYAPAAGAWVDEDFAIAPTTAAGRARVAAEAAIGAARASTVVVRAPGIYGPGRGVVARLRAGNYRVIGDGAAREWIFTGGDYSAQRARDVQLLNEVLPDPAALMARARELAASIAANSPLAVQGSKHVLGFASRREVDANLDYVAVWNAAFLHSEDLGEAMQAFMQRRPPVFRGQ